MLNDGYQKFICEHCGAAHRVPFKDYPVREKGSNECKACGQELHRWNGSRDYYEPELLKST